MHSLSPVDPCRGRVAEKLEILLCCPCTTECYLVTGQSSHQNRQIDVKLGDFFLLSAAGRESWP